MPDQLTHDDDASSWPAPAGRPLPPPVPAPAPADWAGDGAGERVGETAGETAGLRRRASGSWHGGSPRLVAAQGVLVVALFAATGALSGWLWHRLWDPPTGTVTQGVWYTDEAGLRDDFSGTALYLLVAVLAGLLLGLLVSLFLARSELVTLVAVVLGSALAGWLMWRVGVQLSPPDPQQLARAAAEDAVLPGALRISGRTPLVAFPGGSLIALTAVFSMIHKSSPKQG